MVASYLAGLGQWATSLLPVGTLSPIYLPTEVFMTTARELLGQYLAANGLSQAEAGELLECDRTTVFRVLNGSRLPGLGLAVAIERLTDGAIPAKLWVDGPVVNQDLEAAAG